MPDPSSRAAAGRRMAGPPLSGTPGDGDPVPIIMVVSCARPIGAKTSMAAKATVTRIIVLFIQSSFCLLCLQVACTCLLLPRSTHSVQNRNVKVFIILMIFNKSVTRTFHGCTSVGGGRRIRTFGRFTASGFQDQRIRPLCHAPSPHLVGLYDVWGCLTFRGNVG